jgi:xanthine/CO dehydrogenase XdhC/CoxF family maturation factor
MTHEIKQIIQSYLNAQHKGLSCVIATVVDLDGSSYRRPGVRMLINEHGQMTGAVSGGCVEKEILKQSHSVFKSGKAKMITYDGRYRLGCEGTLYILIEIFAPKKGLLECFTQNLDERNSYEIHSYYSKNTDDSGVWGSRFLFKGVEEYSFNRNSPLISNSDPPVAVFKQKLNPCFKLMIIGAEHDAAQLSIMAASLGWEVSVVISPSNPAVLSNFPGAMELIRQNPDQLTTTHIDRQMAIVLMTHSYVKDLEFLFALSRSRPIYIGLLGPVNRRERMLNDLIEKHPSIDDGVFDFIFGPAGLNIGSETPQEIALSICAEILSVVRKQEPKSLKDKLEGIHLNVKL